MSVHCERAEEIWPTKEHTTCTFDLHDLLKVTAHLSSQNNLLVSYETDWTKGGNIFSSQIFYTYVCWGVYLMPRNLGQCKYVLVTKTTNLHSFPLSVSLFKIVLAIIFDCLLNVCQVNDGDLFLGNSNMS